MHQNKISVIVPVFNTESKLLERSVESLRHQTLDDIEIILIDDGSTSSDTMDRLERYDQEGIVVIHVEHNGQGTARNIAFKHSHGEFIGYLDSDDWVDSNFYEVLYNRCINDNSDIACAGMIMEGEVKSYKKYVPKKEVVCTNYEKFQHILDGSCCTKLFNRNIVEKTEFPNGYYFEDNVMLMHLLILSDNVSYEDSIFYHYTVNPMSTTRSSVLLHQRESDSIAVLAYIKGIADTFPEKEGKLLMSKFMKILLLQHRYENDDFYRIVIDTIFTDKVCAKRKLTPLEKVFSVVNCGDKRYKLVTIFGISFSFLRKTRKRRTRRR